MQIITFNYLEQFSGCPILNFENHRELLVTAQYVNERVSSISNFHSFSIRDLMCKNKPPLTLNKFEIQRILDRLNISSTNILDQYAEDIAFLKQINGIFLSITDNEYYMSKMVEEDPFLLEFASKRLQGNEQLVKKALAKAYLTLQFASKQIKENPHIVLFAYLCSYETHIIDLASSTLRNNPDFMEVYDAFINEDEPPPYLVVDTKELVDTPEEILADYSEYIENRLLPIKYEESIGVDQGGLTRDFVTQLFQALHKLDRLGNKSSSGMIYPNCRQETKHLYEGIGKLFGAILSYNYKDIVTGRHFDPPFFKMIHHIVVTLSQNDSFLFSDPVPQLIEYIFDVCGQNALGIDDKTFQDIMQNNHPIILETYAVDNKKEFVEEYFHPYFLSAFYVAKGMRMFMYDFWWKRLVHMTPQEIQEKIEGTLSFSAVLKVLDSEGVDGQTMEYLKEWIQKASPEDLEKFLMFTTGGSALNPDVRLIVKSQRDHRLPTSNTCANTLYLSRYVDYERFQAEMITALNHLMDGFQLA